MLTRNRVSEVCSGRVNEGIGALLDFKRKYGRKKRAQFSLQILHS